jgi:4-alpha-glucanotransferase
VTAPGDGSSAEFHFLFGVHNHQPAGNFDGVVAEAAASAYHPFFEVLRAEPDVRLTVHCSGSLLAWLRERAAPTFDLLGTLAARGQVELLTGGFYEPVLPMLPDTDKVGQVQRLTEFLRASFGVTPRGMWLAERVWEPQLPRVLRAAGVEYVVVDDHHFALAGLDPETLGGYYLTDDQGAAVAVFPISERLRYLVPFAEPAEAVAYLSARRRAGSITLVDDGEKFGVWPGTHRLVYEERWLRRFLDALRQAPGLRVSTFSRVLDSQPSRGRVYLPTASYTEMGEWALPAPAAEEIDAARERLRALPDGAALARLLRGGSWRGFLVKYPEVGDAYWRMLRLSRRLEAALTARPDDARLLEARDRLWRGQANDAYWHGVFGGCYLPHLRRAVRSALIDGDARLAAAEARPALGWEEGADNAAGRVEIRLWSRDAAITLCPHAGGALTELAFRPRALDVADVLTRRREAYHARIAQAASAASAQGDQARSIHDRVAVKEAGLDRLLEYDGLRRASLREGLLRRETGVDALNPWAAAVLAFGAVEMTHRVREEPDALSVTFTAVGPPTTPLALEKDVRLHGDTARISVAYRLTWRGTEPLDARWVVQWNLVLTAGDAFGRYFRLPGHPSLGGRGARADERELVMVDEWIGAELTLGSAEPGDCAWAPVETVSLSEAGLERIYQGSSIVWCWPLRLTPGEARELRIALTLRATPSR